VVPVSRMKASAVNERLLRPSAVVTGGGDPHFGYTIRLTESLGAELILPGTYFHWLDDVSKVIESVIGKLVPPVA
jgi:hypothetical protein